MMREWLGLLLATVLLGGATPGATPQRTPPPATPAAVVSAYEASR